jgi:phosphotransacetylase
MVCLVELAPDAVPADGDAALLLQRYRRADGYDYHVQATPGLEARLPTPFPQGGFGFPSFAAARLFAEGLATAAGVPQLYLRFPLPPPGGAAQGPRIAVCEAEAQAESGLAAQPRGGRTDGSWLGALLARATPPRPLPTAVVLPCEAGPIAAASAAAAKRLIAPILIGPEAEIRRAAAEAGVELAGLRIIPEPDARDAAARAVDLVRAGEVALVMTAATSLERLTAAFDDRERGLRAERRMSCVYVVDAEAFPRPLLITDAALNVAPDLADKRDIVQNAIVVGHALGLETPRVALISAADTVDAKLPSTVEAAALCKMADRGQITGAVLDGPLTFDAAVSVRAAEAAAIASPVAGYADILVAPDLVAADLLARELAVLGGAQTAGVAVGAPAPIVLTPRGGGERSALAACAVAVQLARGGRAA